MAESIDVSGKGRSGFRRPENFDVIKRYERPGVAVWGGANDWEAGPTCVAVSRSLNKGSEADGCWRLWLELEPPEGCDDFGYVTDSEKESGLDEKSKEELVRKQGDRLLELLEESARRANDGEVPSSLGRWIEAVVHGPDELLGMVARCGSDLSHWKGTNAVKDAFDEK